jgi:hypothetical protein
MPAVAPRRAAHCCHARMAGAGVAAALRKRGATHAAACQTTAATAAHTHTHSPTRTWPKVHLAPVADGRQLVRLTLLVHRALLASQQHGRLQDRRPRAPAACGVVAVAQHGGLAPSTCCVLVRVCVCACACARVCVGVSVCVGQGTSWGDEHPGQGQRTLLPSPPAAGQPRRGRATAAPGAGGQGTPTAALGSAPVATPLQPPPLRRATPANAPGSGRL